MNTSDAPRGVPRCDSRWCGKPPISRCAVPASACLPRIPARPVHVAIDPCLLRVHVKWWTQLTDAWAGLVCVGRADAWAELMHGPR